MLELDDEYTRRQAALELGFLSAIRVAVPACFDDKAGRSYEEHEQRLLDKINGAPSDSDR